MRSLILSCLAVAILLMHVADCSLNVHDKSDDALAELLKRELEKSLAARAKKAEHHFVKTSDVDGRKMFMNAIQHGLLGSESSVKADAEDADYFQSTESCPDGTVMKLKPFHAMIYPGLGGKQVDLSRRCSHTIEVSEGEQVYFIFIMTREVAGDDCTDGALDIYDGEKPTDEGHFIHLCSGSLPNIVSSKTNKVTIQYSPGKTAPGGLWIYYINSGDANFTPN